MQGFKNVLPGRGQDRAEGAYPDSQNHAERTAAESGTTMTCGSRASW
jgi:hypothetical protein